MISSDSSLLGAMPPRPMLRSSTSAPINSVIASSSRHASRSRTSSRRPYQLDSRAITGRVATSGPRLIRLGEEALQLWTMLRALAHDPGPTRLVGLVVIGPAGGTLELDGLDAGIGLPLGILGILLGEDRNRLGFSLLAGLAQHVALRVGEPVPDRFVHQDRHLGRIESGIDAVFGLLVPSEIEDAR